MRLVAPVVIEFYGGGGCSLPVNIRFVSRNIKTNLKKKKIPGATRRICISLLPLSLLEFDLALGVVEVCRNGDDGVVVVVHIVYMKIIVSRNKKFKNKKKKYPTRFEPPFKVLLLSPLPPYRQRG